MNSLIDPFTFLFVITALAVIVAEGLAIVSKRARSMVVAPGRKAANDPVWSGHVTLG